MKKINFKNVGVVLSTLCVAIIAMALTLTACKKDENLKNGLNRATTGQVPYTDFDPNLGWYVNSNWVEQGNNGVKLHTEFTGGLVWHEKKSGTGTTADGQWNEVQKITVRKSLNQTDQSSVYGENEFPSFCAHVGSWYFSNNPYAPSTLPARAYNNIRSAFNYIYDTYGSIDGWCEGNSYQAEVGLKATRVLAQMAVWYFVPEDTPEWEIVDIYPTNARYSQIKDAFAGVIAAVERGYSGNGYITSLAYLATPSGSIGANQPQIVPIFKDDYVTPLGGCAFLKNKLVNGENEPAEEGEFEFELWRTDANWNSTTQITDEDCGYPFKTTGFGGAVEAMMLEPGNYVFKEKVYADWILDLPAGVDGLYFTITDKHITEWRDFTDFQPNVVNIPNTPPPPPLVLGPAYGSVTATKAGNVPNIINSLNPKNGNPQDPQSFNAGVVYGSNHFTYAAFTMAELVAGVKLDFVVGNKFQIVGSGMAKYENGNLVVTIDNFGKGDFGVIAFTGDMVAKKFPKNGNIHSQKEADLKKELGATTGFNHDNKTIVPCPVPANATGKIYLYIHCGTIQFYQ